MKKVLLILLSLFLVAGCSPVDYKTELKKGLEEAAYAEYDRSENHRKDFYSFYIDGSVSLKDSGISYSVFEYLGNTFSMNLNVENIVSGRYFNIVENDYSQELKTVDEIGTFVNDYGNKYTYRVVVYEENGLCLLILDSNQIKFYSVLKDIYVYDVAVKMMSILKSVNVKTDAVINAYSSIDDITYVKETTELFNTYIPSNTTLEEIVKQSQGIAYEETINEEEMASDMPIED